MRVSDNQVLENYAAFKANYSEKFASEIEKAVDKVSELLVQPPPVDCQKTCVNNEQMEDECVKTMEKHIVFLAFMARQRRYGANLETIRTERGLSRESVGKALCVTQEKIKEIERAKDKNINPIYMKMLCLFYDVHPEHLLGKEFLNYPMVHYDERKAACIQQIIWNLSSDSGDAIGDKLLNTLLMLPKVKNSSIRKKAQNKDEQEQKDTSTQVNSIFRAIPAIPNLESLELPCEHKIIPIRNWDGFLDQVDTLSSLYDRNPDFMKYIFGISSCNDSIQEMAYFILIHGGFKEIDRIYAELRKNF